MTEGKAFHENLDELIALFKKIKENKEQLKLENIDITFMDDFEILLSNYDLIKESVSPDMLDSLGAPIKELIEGLIEQLKIELQEIIKQGNIDININETPLQDELEHINELLRRENLSVADIDYLLDKRAELLRQQNEKK